MSRLSEDAEGRFPHLEAWMQLRRSKCSPGAEILTYIKKEYSEFRSCYGKEASYVKLGKQERAAIEEYVEKVANTAEFIYAVCELKVVWVSEESCLEVR
jgi:hypothetical protein